MSGRYESARDLSDDLELSADVVVVGSGAGGAVVATELARSGQEVIVLEEGPNVPPDVYGRWRPSESVRHIWRDGAMSVAVGLGDTPAINVMMGRCVGGSSVLTGGVCFRIPEPVMAHWTEELGLTGYDTKSMEPFFEQVERDNHVEEVPVSMRSRSTELFAEGSRRRGVELAPMERNTKDCGGCGRCNFGCPRGAKLGVDISYLPRAVEAGADVWSHCLVERVLTKGSRAVGVQGRLLNRSSGKPGHSLRVHARRVVLAAGAWHTPLLLKGSGIGGRAHVGRNLTLHPGFRVIARFDEPVRGWRGALQSAWTDAYEDEGITLTSLFVPPAVLAATMPGVGPEHVRRAAQADHLAIFGGIVHDSPSGTVRRGLGREPIVTYRMSKRDRARVPLLIRVMAETFFEAGAKEVYLPILGQQGFSADALAHFPLEKIPGRRFECTSQHPLGTCQMAASPQRGVVDSDGKVFDMTDLYVADGSVMPTSLGVNPQLSIMAVAARMAHAMLERPLPS